MLSKVSPSLTMYSSLARIGAAGLEAALSAGMNENLPLVSTAADFLDVGITISSFGVDRLIKRLITVVIANVIITPQISPVTKYT